MKTILTDRGSFEAAPGEGLWLSADEVERVSGWTLKPEGMCQADECVPLAADAIRSGRVDLAAFWARLDAPIVHSEANDVWVLGASAQARNRALADEVAPDFTLPDLDGTPRALSSLRGRKVFLFTWASW